CLGEIFHNHARLRVEVVRREDLAVDIGCDLAGAEDELLRAFGGHHMRIIREWLGDSFRVDAGDLCHGRVSALRYTLTFSSSTTRPTAGRLSIRSLKAE